MAKESIKLFGVEIIVNNVTSSGEESTSGTGGLSSISSSHRSSKGRRWTEDEQRAFLIGLDKLGKGNWTEIAKHFVPTRTPTQVASHAQKYFDRQKENRALKPTKSSVFDINLDQESSNTCPELVSKNNKNEESPISAMPISYILPHNVLFNGSYTYVPTTNSDFANPNSASVDNLDLTL